MFFGPGGLREACFALLSAMARTGFEDLPPEVLCLICSKLVSREPIKTLPLVSKKVLEFTRTETQLWRVVNFSLEHTAQQNTWAKSRAQLQAFVSWLERRAAGVQRLVLRLDLPEAAAVREEAWRLVLRALASVAPNLQQLELGWPGPLEVGAWFAALPKLTLALLDARQLQLTQGMAGCLSLRNLALSLPGRGPGLSFQGRQACLPPGLESVSLFGAGLKSLPMAQLAQLRALISLDLSCNPRLRAEDYTACLESLTTLRELGFSSCSLPSLPHQLSLLAELRVLYLHQAFTQEWAEAGPAAAAAEFEAALGPLRHLAMLSLSCCGLMEVPPAVAALTSLRVLHVEDNSLQLCAGPYLSGLRELCIDWNTLFASHTVLRSQRPPHLSKLLLNGSQHTLGEDGAANPPAAVAASLAACPSLAHLVDVLPEGSGGQLDFEVAQLMCLLPSAYPRLRMTVTNDDDFGYSLATLPPEWGCG